MSLTEKGKNTRCSPDLICGTSRPYQFCNLGHSIAFEPSQFMISKSQIYGAVEKYFFRPLIKRPKAKQSCGFVPHIQMARRRFEHNYKAKLDIIPG
ncbi:hypothetical protein TWF594_005246 [Orbilia oligospora]|nr:hypothetical protein TWF706_004719 [Orbilia oligospora]KAF3143183.1 hypothetical protein TWF594_005246 [Orbilia oligospora]